MYKLKCILLVIPLILSLSKGSNAQISKEQAIDSVLVTIVAEDSLNFNVYLHPNICRENNFNLSPYLYVQNPYDSAWIFFVDMFPERGWGHSCKYIIVDKLTGQFIIFIDNLPPRLYWLTWEEISVPFPHQLVTQSTDTTFKTNSEYEPDPNKYALLITWNAWEDTARWNNLSHIYTGLKLTYGFTDENIFVLSDDGIFDRSTMNLDLDHLDNYCDFDGPCTKDSIEDIFMYLQSEMDEDDLFLFYATTHGDTLDGDLDDTTALVLWDTLLWDYELEEMIDGINCSYKIFSIDACYAGGFVEELSGNHSVVNVPVARDMGTIRNWKYFDFFSYAWGTAVRGWHPKDKKKPYDADYKIGMHPDLAQVYPTWWNNPDTLPDLVSFNGNGDGVIQFGEVFRYAQYLDGQTLVSGIESLNHGFVEDLLSLNGISGKVETSQTVEGNFLVGGPLSIESDVDLTLDDNGRFYLHNAELSIATDASLTLGENTLITGDPSGIIDADGAIITDNHNDFSAAENGTLDIQLGSEPFEIADGTFTNCLVESHANPLEITGSVLEHSLIEYYFHDLTISGSSFTNSSISAVHFSLNNPPLEKIFKVIGCNFQTAHEESNAAIEIYGYRNFTIAGNSIDNEDNPEDVDNGISINYSGGLAEDNTHTVIDNEIFCSSSSCDNDLAGITVYSGVAEINGNNIHDNQFGIQSLNFSNLQVIGNKNASFEYETQRIKNNKYCQIFASANAFPVLTSWNAIYSTETNDCFIVHDVDMQNLPPDVDVSYNYWGSGFEPDRNLCPPGHYVYRPEWVLQEEEDNLLSNAQQLYESAMIQIEESDFAEAKSTLQEVISLYPGEEPAIHSLKDLFVLEPFADNDFDALKSWYLTDSAILSQENLLQLADNLANKCDENLGNFSAAIEWYENKIDNPETLEDSVFAIIDLEHLYLQMSNDTTQRSFTFTGKYSQYKPASFKAYKDHRDLLIELLHSWDNEQANDDNPLIKNDLNGNTNFAIAPNPFTNKTKINYYLDNEATVQINIFNNLGQLVETVTEIGKSKGNYSYEFDASELNTGIYFCTLIVNGKATASMKMMVL